MQVHHRDRDRSNNAPSNLETLCERCHTAEHVNEIRETKRNMVYLRLSSSQRARWDAAAKARGKNLSWMIREAVEVYLGAEPTPDVGRDRVREERGHVGVPAYVPVQERAAMAVVPVVAVAASSFKPDFGKRLKPDGGKK